jgi:hypothetical protein
MEVWEIPELEEMLDGGSRTGSNRYRCQKSYEDAVNETSIIIHSSGTTGGFALSVQEASSERGGEVLVA